VWVCVCVTAQRLMECLQHTFPTVLSKSHLPRRRDGPNARAVVPRRKSESGDVINYNAVAVVCFGFLPPAFPATDRHRNACRVVRRVLRPSRRRLRRDVRNRRREKRAYLTSARRRRFVRWFGRLFKRAFRRLP